MESSGPRIAVIDDEEDIRCLLVSELEAAGFEVRTARDGLAGLEAIRDWEPSLILLDVMMPKIDGISILPRFRALTQAPIFILSAKGETGDKVFGLDRGADQYLAKPFETPELIARIRSALRRPQLDDPDVLTDGDLQMDRGRRIVRRGDRQLVLTAREFGLLETFLRKPRRVYSKDELIDRVWGINSEVSSNCVETYISYLRAKLNTPEQREQLIVTIRGAGYALRK
ncbi:MAG TPA: response regulator transcription factor [Candidatus Cybelea sp.]|jgi:DNA-binding response OmpR family regulator|nr:response regulator transcription factor [Candidatus Cybelea sp.]